MSNKNLVHPAYYAHIGWQEAFGDDYYAFGYIDSYKEAGDILVEQGNADLLIFPIMFCYRQYLELLLKNIYYAREADNYNRYIGKVSHSLVKSWEYVKPLLEGEKTEEDIKYLEKMIEYFDKKDPDSFSFRYQFDKHGNKNINGDIMIDTLKLKENMAKIESILLCTYEDI